MEQKQRTIENIMGLLLLPIAMISEAFLFLKFYNWFIIPHFNLPNFSLIEAIGINLFLLFFKFKGMGLVYDKDQTILRKTIGLIGWYAIVLFIGWIVYLNL